MNKETKQLLEQIRKLEDEGFVNFRTNKSEIVDFVENGMQYVVLEKDGEVTKYSSCRLACGKTWKQVKDMKVKGSPSDLDKAYFNDNHIRLTWFNYKCWSQLGMIFLSPHDYHVIKFHRDKK